MATQVRVTGLVSFTTTATVVMFTSGGSEQGGGGEGCSQYHMRSMCSVCSQQQTAITASQLKQL